MADTVSTAGAPALFGARNYQAALEWAARRAEAFVIPLAALIVGMALFSLFIALVGKSPVQLYETMWLGGLASWFSIQHYLSRAAPL
ncbi:ABC transporter permease, partial [Mesorhizobium sp. M0767]